jgi:predicted aconitase with swiveling domain
VVRDGSASGAAGGQARLPSNGKQLRCVVLRSSRGSCTTSGCYIELVNSGVRDGGRPGQGQVTV